MSQAGPTRNSQLLLSFFFIYFLVDRGIILHATMPSCDSFKLEMYSRTTKLGPHHATTTRK